MGKKLTDEVSQAGKVNWELIRFHGDEYSTYRGSSYNSYLIRDRKTVLMDTVWQPFDREFVAHLKQEVDLKSIDYIVMNHNEIDHSGALPELMREIPNTPTYCTANGTKILKGHYHQDWNFVTVKTGDTLDIGDSKLIFVEAQMLHWPDTMFTCMTGENILFNNDAFGQYYATESLYDDVVDRAELLAEVLKYYVNILTPFSKFVAKKIHGVLGLNLPASVICPGHGVIWRSDPTVIVEQYLRWADNYQENRITLVYDTIWNSTREMAEAITAGTRDIAPSITVKLMNSAKGDKNDTLSEVLRFKAILVGSSIINNGYLFSIGDILEMVKGLKFKEKRVAAFGSYGWSDETVKQLTEELEKAGFQIVSSGHRALWVLGEAELGSCREFGRQFAAALSKEIQAFTGRNQQIKEEPHGR